MRFYLVARLSEMKRYVVLIYDRYSLWTRKQFDVCDKVDFIIKSEIVQDKKWSWSGLHCGYKFIAVVHSVRIWTRNLSLISSHFDQ
jgi:hypothetical protein